MEIPYRGLRCTCRPANIRHYVNIPITPKKGRPLRDHNSTTYVSSFGTISEFGQMLRWEALRRRMGEAVELVILIDGAAGLAAFFLFLYPCPYSLGLIDC
jgi:hypothetical protein